MIACWQPAWARTQQSAWLAARPSGTEDIYKIYAESFRGADHLHRILEEAQRIVSDALDVVLPPHAVTAVTIEFIPKPADQVKP